MAMRVETNVPYGNAADVHVTQEGETAVVRFTADPHGGPEAMWFRFRVRPTGRTDARRLRLVLTNLGNLLGGRSGEAVRPVVCEAKESWRRLPAGRTVTLPDGRLEATWELDAPRTYLDVALCYPYGLPELERLLDESAGYWQRDTIGVSQGGRPLVRLSNDYGQVREADDGRQGPDQRAGIYLLARQHSSETPGSWVLDGFLRRLGAMGGQAPLTWCVPLTNIDGVEQGDYGKDNFPYDLNRAWSRPAMRHEVLVFQRDMQRWRRRCRPALVLDFHAPGMCEGGGLYVFVPPVESEDWHARALTWTEPMAAALGEAYVNDPFARVARHGSRWDTPNSTRFARETLEVMGLSLEVPYATAGGGEMLLTIDAYREAGARLAAAVAERARAEAAPATAASDQSAG